MAERLGADLRLSPLPAGASSGHIPVSIEDKGTFAGIAVAKALWYSRRIPSGLVIASDGGLLIPGLKGEWDPIRTARFAGPAADGPHLAATLLHRARRLKSGDRRIGWVEALAVARDGELLAQWAAHGPPGELAYDLPSSLDQMAGFWVPYVWRCPEYGGRRLSELTERERLARRDHWAILADHLAEWVQQDTGS